MRKKTSSITSIIALICIAAYASALLYGAYLIYRNFTERRIAAGQELSDLARRSSAAGASGFMDTDFQQIIEDTLTSSRTIQGVIVSGPDGEYAFERELSGAINWVGDSPRFASRIGTSSKTEYLSIEGLRNATISAAYSYIDVDYFIAVLKKTLIIILAALSAAFLCLILEAALGKKKDEEDEPPVIRDDEFYTPPLPVASRARPAAVPHFMPPFTAKQSGAAVKEEPKPWEDSPVMPSPVQPQEPPAGETARQEDEVEFREPSMEDPDFQEDAAEFQEPPMEDPDFQEDTAEFQEPSMEDPDFQEDATEFQEPVAAELPAAETARSDDTPRSLYSPRGISWEDYTVERLEAELNRCASSDQDLTLMVMEYREDGADEAAYARLVDAAVGCFNLRDLIFEKGNQGVSVIIPNAGLEQGLARAEEFLDHLRAADPDAAATPVSIGLSSRSGRLVNAGRLLFEASQAMQKAGQDPASPIIAFKSDPEKYRAFIQRTR